ncbi:MAG: hypothetical protein MR489_05300 [Prevotella sp.]|nr:hypothetical protein [Prevotella sp.]
MDWIMYFIAFILGGIAMFMTICIVYAAKREEPVNRAHFYVARDKDGTLFLYIGKPYRTDTQFCGSIMDESVILLTGYHFESFGLNENDYKELKWEDEPLEVFVNMED